jgi:hypothetical protein
MNGQVACSWAILFLFWQYTLYLVTLVILRVRVMVFNTTLNNISAITCWLVLLVDETGVPGENHRHDKCYHIMLFRVCLTMIFWCRDIYKKTIWENVFYKYRHHCVRHRIACLQTEARQKAHGSHLVYWKQTKKA